jgi:hypothetical protein
MSLFFYQKSLTKIWEIVYIHCIYIAIKAEILLSSVSFARAMPVEYSGCILLRPFQFYIQVCSDDTLYYLGVYDSSTCKSLYI